MTMDRSRRDRFATGAVPMTWEPWAAGALAALSAALMIPLVVQGLIGWVASGTYVWPTGRILEAYGGLLHGHFGHGLSRSAPGRLPADPVMWLLTALTELTLVAIVVAVGPRIADGAGIGSRHGLATSTQAAAALGLLRLRSTASVIRPDLYARPWPRRSSGPSPRLPSASIRSWCRRRSTRVDPEAVAWRLGRAGRNGPTLWVPFDRTTCVIGPQGSGKTLDLLAPALISAPGAALVTLTKPEDLFLTLQARRTAGGPDRPVAVLDPFNLAPGTPELVWDPVEGCEDAMHAERRAKAFAAGTIRGATAQTSDQAARFYAGECAKVLQAYFHAAAIAGVHLDEVLTWVASPRQNSQAEEILRTHPAAEPLWDGLLRGALFGDERTAGNTITTVQQAMALFFQGSIRARCIPTAERPATDLEALIGGGGTIYLLGREDPYASASPLMTAVTEHVLDTAKRLGETSQHGRLCPPFLACLDELPSTAPIPTLSTRMANERALGLVFILAAQTWRQLVVCYGEDQARTIYGLSNNVVVFGGGKDIRFYQELSDLIGSTTHTETKRSRRAGPTGRWLSVAEESWDQRRVPILEAAELRRIEQRKALVLAETYDPIIASLQRCVDGKQGKKLLLAQEQTRRASHRGDTNNLDGHLADPDAAHRADVVGQTTDPASRLLGLPNQAESR